MSGRRLGRLLGSVLAIAAAAVAFNFGLHNDAAGSYLQADLIWTAAPADMGL